MIKDLLLFNPHRESEKRASLISRHSDPSSAATSLIRTTCSSSWFHSQGKINRIKFPPRTLPSLLQQFQSTGIFFFLSAPISYTLLSRQYTSGFSWVSSFSINSSSATESRLLRLLCVTCRGSQEADLWAVKKYKQQDS